MRLRCSKGRTGDTQQLHRPAQEGHSALLRNPFPSEQPGIQADHRRNARCDDPVQGDCRALPAWRASAGNRGGDQLGSGCIAGVGREETAGVGMERGCCGDRQTAGRRFRRSGRAGARPAPATESADRRQRAARAREECGVGLTARCSPITEVLLTRTRETSRSSRMLRTVRVARASKQRTSERGDPGASKRF